MADDADIAAENMKEIDVSEISIQFLKPSEEFCIECDDEIPTARRALGGVLRCIHCQSEYERTKR